MKIRNGFVSNSSSTSFYFIFNGEKEDLLRLIIKYAMFFEFPGDRDDEDVFNRGMTIRDLLEAMEPLRFVRWNEENPPNYDDYDVCIVSADEAEKEAIKDFHEYVGKSAGDESKGMRDIYSHYAKEQLDLAMEVGHGVKRGLHDLAVIDMGDHHGQIEGGLVGEVMDYRGRHIRIDKEDFIVLTIQNR